MTTISMPVRTLAILLACGIGLGAWASPVRAQHAATRSVTDDPEMLRRVPRDYVHSTGLTFRYPSEWTARDEGPSVTLLPSEPGISPGTNIAVESQPWTGAMPLNHPETASQMAPQYLASMPGFQQEGSTDVLDAVGADGIAMRFVRTLEDGRTIRVHVLAKTLNGHYISVAIIGDSPSVQALDGQGFQVFMTAQGGGKPPAFTPAPTPGPAPAPVRTEAEILAAKYPRVLDRPGSGYTMRCPADWSAQAQGAATVLVPAGSMGEMYTIASAPWMPGLPLENPMVAEQIGAMLAANMPGLARAGGAEPLGAPGEGVMLRYVLNAPGGASMPVRVLAKSTDRALVMMIGAGTEGVLAHRESTLKEMFKTVAITGTPAIASPTPAARPSFPQAGAPTPPSAQPPLGQLDPNLVGVWSTEVAMGGGGGWNVDGGMTSFASRMAYVFNPDGTYLYGSASVGGGAPGTQFNNGFRATSAGRWYVASDGQAMHFVLVDQQTGPGNPVRYTFHNGQLVLGTQGSRSFWSRAQ